MAQFAVRPFDTDLGALRRAESGMNTTGLSGDVAAEIGTIRRRGAFERNVAILGRRFLLFGCHARSSGQTS
jgi:hypothetical protein